MIRRAVLALLFAAAVWRSAGDYARLVRDSFAMLRLPYEERRERILGGDYVVMRRLAAELPRDQAVAIVLRRPKDIDRGIFLNAQLYPRTTRIYDGVDKYRADAHRPRLAVVVDGAEMRVEQP